MSAKNSASAFTLVELMVVIAIIAALAVIAVPTVSRDASESEFRGYVRRLAQDMRRARYEAISSREDRLIFIPVPPAGQKYSYTLEAVVPNTTTRSPVKRPEQAPAGVEINGVLTLAARPSTTYSPAAAQLPAEIRFTGINTVQAVAGGTAGTVAPGDAAATVFLSTTDNKHKARIVIYQTTAYTRTYMKW